MNSTKDSKRCKRFGKIPARLVLYFLSLGGMVVTYTMRIAINLTILAMVKEKPENPNFNFTEPLCYTIDNSTQTPIDYGGTLDWSFDDQYYILSSFYWTYLIAHPFGGNLTQKFGTKKVFISSLVISAICNLCIPFFSHIHYVTIVILQLIHGFSQGFAWPAIYAVIAVWIPINERSRFVTCFQGLTLGIMAANLVAAYVLVTFGWAYVFYCTGGLGLFCATLWYLLMYDKPEYHPRISQQELDYIQENREHNLHSEKIIPWVSILTSLPVWAIGIISFGRMWVSSIMQIYGPLYLKTMIGLTIEMNGLLLGVSSIVSFFVALLFSLVADKIATHKLMPLVYNRKMFAVVGQIIPGIMVLALGYINCNIPLVAAMWFLIQSLFTANFLGSMSNIVDISPSYTGPVSSLVQIILLLPTILSPLVTKTLLQHEATVMAWRNIFYICSGVVVGTSIFFAVFASGKMQPWDLSRSSRDLGNRKVKTELLNND